MDKVNWADILGWNEEQYAEMRFSGFSYLRDGKYLQALLFFKALVLLNPQNVYDRQTLGALYLQMNKHKKALFHLNEALKIEPHDEITLLNKVKALIMLGEKKEGLILAQMLQKSRDPQIADDATALILAHR